MKKIGILYICTGKYDVFWKDFYLSFEEKFLNDCELHYYVFTDSKNIYDSDRNNRIHIKYLETLPWPLITLFRYRYFISIEKDLIDMDYLMFFNSNLKCVEKIYKEDILPRKEKGENLFAVIHPGYEQTKIRNTPLERNKKSWAYVPYNKGKQYTIGAFNGGNAKAFLELSHKLNKAIEEDLKKNIIAKWHDESHFNRYIIERNDCRILSPEYCYPVGLKVDYKAKITGVSKAEKFDVNNFKGVYEKDVPCYFVRACKYGMNLLKNFVMYIRDTVLNKKVKKYNF